VSSSVSFCFGSGYAGLCYIRGFVCFIRAIRVIRGFSLPLVAAMPRWFPSVATFLSDPCHSM
jgi:hypothetical protein